MKKEEEKREKKTLQKRMHYMIYCSVFSLSTVSCEYVYIESLMSCHLLLHLLHELANMILCEALPSIMSFLPTNVIHLVINDNEFEILFIT